MASSILQTYDDYMNQERLRIGQACYFTATSGCEIACRVSIFAQSQMGVFACLPAFVYRRSEAGPVIHKIAVSNTVFSDEAQEMIIGTCVYVAQNRGANLCLVELKSERRPENLIHYPYSLVPKTQNLDMQALMNLQQVLVHKGKHAVKLRQRNQSIHVAFPPAVHDWVAKPVPDNAALKLPSKYIGAPVTAPDPRPEGYPYIETHGVFCGMDKIGEDLHIFLAPLCAALQDCARYAGQDLRVLLPYMQATPDASHETDLSSLENSFLSRMDTGYGSSSSAF